MGDWGESENKPSEGNGRHLPGHAVVSGSESKGGAKGVGQRRAGAPAGGPRHGLDIHRVAVLAALGKEGRHSEGLGRSRVSETLGEATCTPQAFPKYRGLQKGKV